MVLLEAMEVSTELAPGTVGGRLQQLSFSCNTMCRICCILRPITQARSDPRGGGGGGGGLQATLGPSHPNYTHTHTNTHTHTVSHGVTDPDLSWPLACMLLAPQACPVLLGA